MNNTIVDQIKEHCMSGARCNPNLHRKDWWDRRGLTHLYEYSVNYTNFLPSTVRWVTRIWHILNQIDYIPVCKRAGCNKPSKWQDTFYQDYCCIKCHNTCNIVLESRKSSNLEKYGTEHFLSNKDVRQQIKKTCIEKYGVDNPTKHPEILAKIKQTTLQRYGHECIFASTSMREHSKSVMLEKFGQEYYLQSDDYKTKMAEYKTATGRDNVNQLHISDESYLKLKDAQWMLDTHRTHGILYIAKQLDVSNSCVRSWLHTHGLPARSIVSSFEKEIIEYIKSIYTGTIITSDRKILGGKEIDILLPDCSLGIECNGAYWHAELQGKDSKYHLHKTELANKSGIHIFNIWDYEWYNYTNLIKSRIASFLGKNCKIYARNTDVRSVSFIDASKFLGDNHIQGQCQSSVQLGLYQNDTVVALMTFGKSRYNKIAQWELLRYCSAINTNVIGGASKLLAAFRTNNSGSIISYSDRMRNKGELYNRLGFKFMHNSKPSYIYTKDYTEFENRVVYQKHKLESLLEKYDPSKTEWENMKDNKFDRLWDCGTSVWILQ